MLQAVIDILLNIVLYIPRKIYSHFDYMDNLKYANKSFEKDLEDRENILKRIINECDYNMQINNYKNSYAGFRKIKELAETFHHEH